MKWRKIGLREIMSPAFQARQAEHRAGYAEGRATYARFEERRDFTDLVDPPSPAWLAGYELGYSRAEKGKA